LNWSAATDSEDRDLMVQLSPLYLERIEAATQQGIEREALALVMRQLRRRLGTIAPEMEAQIRSLSIDRLEDLGEALLDFQSETDLIDWLDRTNR